MCKCENCILIMRGKSKFQSPNQQLDKCLKLTTLYETCNFKFLEDQTCIFWEDISPVEHSITEHNDVFLRCDTLLVLVQYTIIRTQFFGTQNLLQPIQQQLYISAANIFFQFFISWFQHVILRSELLILVQCDQRANESSYFEYHIILYITGFVQDETLIHN